jgi:hypothetical protein
MLVGCGLAPKGPVRDPYARPPSPSGVSSPSASRRPVATPTLRTLTTSASGFSSRVTVACGGTPTGEQVISLLRRLGVLTAQQRATVTTGPLCAGTWQYTVVSVPAADPMNVVTRGQPTALALVTAGTNPCTAKVRAEAPEGIRSALRCDT